MVEFIDECDGWKVYLKSWCREIEESARKQINNLLQLPFVFHHVAIMPDCHMGYGMPIGGVLATEGVVIPNAVGVDIGCGMCAVKTSLTEITSEDIKKILGGSKEYQGGIRSAVPVGRNKHSKAQDYKLMPGGHRLYKLDMNNCDIPICCREFSNALKSLGTLGGGNHFIEIQKGDDNHIWVMIHSGSRNLGKQVADHYNKIAIELNQKWYSSVPNNWQLAFLPIHSEEGQAYLDEMQYCVDFAKANRDLMMDRIKELFHFHADAVFEDTINIAHNYARMENHFGKNVMVHRKGATSAKLNELGIIPGSQGTKSYIVKGLGNPESFYSCSHGAGRLMSRTAAQRDLVLEDEIKLLNDKGVLHAIRGNRDLDEAPGAYKSIDEVMAQQTDLVEIITELQPLAVIKG